MPDLNEVPGYIECHDVEGLRRYFDEGGDPNGHFSDGMPIFTMMVEMYLRSPRFKDCVQVFIDHGLKYSRDELLAVFTDDADRLEKILKDEPELVDKTYSLFNNAFTPLTGATLLHFCAEYNSVNCAGVLLEHGADINAKAGIDEYGFGGHTPIFHTVNQVLNNSRDMLYFLLNNDADLDITVKGLIWGKGYEWETFIPSVNPISYAMMGLLPQMHRKDIVVGETVSLLIKHAYDIDYLSPNVPNKYLR